MKKIVISFDGTCNEPEDAEQERGFFGLGELEDSSITNVLKLHLMLGGDLLERSKFEGQECFYYSGVGTHGGALQRAFNAGLSLQSMDVDHIILSATRDLRRVYEEGDEVFVFGFSRGAAIARQFASLLPKDFPHHTPKIKFMGVYDTVASIGLPNLDENDKPVSDVVFENNTIAPAIEQAVHIVALDEKRKAFMPTLMNKDDTPVPETGDARVMEIWFAGAHTDVGGGRRMDGLSDTALEFMLEELNRRGFGLKILHPTEINYTQLVPASAGFKIDYMDVMMEPKFWGVSHQQRRIFTGWLTLEDRDLRVNVDDKMSNNLPLLHHSVSERVHGDTDYRPESVINVTHRMLMPDGEIEQFDGLKAHRMQGATPTFVLEEGESKQVMVYARKKYNQSGVLMLAGEKYGFEVDMTQKWYDASIDATVEGWSAEDEDMWIAKELAIKASRRFRRIPDAKWFELSAAVGQNDDELFQVLNHTDEGNPYIPAKNGEFCPFANDLDNRYGNNLGFVNVTIKRLSS